MRETSMELLAQRCVLVWEVYLTSSTYGGCRKTVLCVRVGVEVCRSWVLPVCSQEASVKVRVAKMPLPAPRSLQLQVCPKASLSLAVPGWRPCFAPTPTPQWLWAWIALVQKMSRTFSTFPRIPGPRMHLGCPAMVFGLRGPVLQ